MTIRCTSPYGRRPRGLYSPWHAHRDQPAGPGHIFGLEDRNRVRNSFLANADHWVRMSLADMIFSGVFERYPKTQGRHRGARTVLDFRTS